MGTVKYGWILKIFIFHNQIKTIKIKNWRRIAMKRSRWSEIVQQARTHEGM
jgi:hypothetical protein